MIQHPPGCHRISDRTYFTVYAPYAKKVRLLLFTHCNDENPSSSLPMRAISGGYWEYSDIRSFTGNYYAFQIDDQAFSVADPYARSVSTFNDYHQEAKAYICEDDFDWGDDHFVSPADPRDLIIYEAHVKDMTAHASSDVPYPGTYTAFIEKIPYLKSLGINAVEFLPLQQFANFEPPYFKDQGKFNNTWNPYAYNYWGYMTAFFFAPAGIYSRSGNRDSGHWSDPRGDEITEFKQLIKALHREGITVIMDVVYNHISQYNLNPLRKLAEDQYLALHSNNSWCGNDVRSDAPVTRQLIVDSIRYWMETFHIDGFRFDMTGIIDDETLISIRNTAKQINPNTILVGEPWGKRYFPQRMSELGIGVWNDIFRNGVKGENPIDRRGFIFGHWERDLNKDSFIKILTGSLIKDGGIVNDSRNSVNYIASHDGYTLGDFIRLAVRGEKNAVKKDHEEHVRISEEEWPLHKLAAFMLMMSQGIVMMHAGQEFARTKVIIPETGIQDPMVGQLDHDSYNKDNETNYINHHDIDINKDLVDYYRGLIAVRKAFPELRSSHSENISPLYATNNEFGLGYSSHSDSRNCTVLLNTSPTQDAVFTLDEGTWNIHVNNEFASKEAQGTLKGGEVILAPCSQLFIVKNTT